MPFFATVLAVFFNGDLLKVERVFPAPLPLMAAKAAPEAVSTTTFLRLTFLVLINCVPIDSQADTALFTATCPKSPTPEAASPPLTAPETAAKTVGPISNFSPDDFVSIS